MPEITAAQKAEWKQKALQLDALAGSSASAGLGLLLFPEPTLITKVFGAIGVVTGAVELGAAVYYAKKAKDPPDPNFRVISRPATRAPPKVRAGGGMTPRVASAANALLANAARYAAYARVSLTSLERAQGAFEAGDAAWQGRQEAAAAQYAMQEARLLEARAALRARLRRALGGLGPRPTVADVHRAKTQVAKKGLPPLATSILRKLGMTGADIAAHRRAIARVNPKAAARPVGVLLVDPNVTAAERAGARLLRGLAASLRA